jgi:uncharacterized lipoprotein
MPRGKVEKPALQKAETEWNAAHHATERPSRRGSSAHAIHISTNPANSMAKVVVTIVRVRPRSSISVPVSNTSAYLACVTSELSRASATASAPRVMMPMPPNWIASSSTNSPKAV